MTLIDEARQYAAQTAPVVKPDEIELWLQRAFVAGSQQVISDCAVSDKPRKVLHQHQEDIVGWARLGMPAR